MNRVSFRSIETVAISALSARSSPAPRQPRWHHRGLSRCRRKPLEPRRQQPLTDRRTAPSSARFRARGASSERPSLATASAGLPLGIRLINNLQAVFVVPLLGHRRKSVLERQSR